MDFTNSFLNYEPQPAPRLTNKSYWDFTNGALLNITKEKFEKMRKSESPNRHCRNKFLCKTRKFSIDVSSSAAWPDPAEFIELAKLLKAKDSPAHQHGCHVLNDSNKLDEAKEFVEKNFVKIRFLQKFEKTDLIKFSWDYEIGNFMADVGGIMGIYLGASVLSLGEFVELVWTILVTNFQFGRAKSTITD
jgi:hypothetical protein